MSEVVVKVEDKRDRQPSALPRSSSPHCLLFLSLFLSKKKKSERARRGARRDEDEQVLPGGEYEREARSLALVVTVEERKHHHSIDAIKKNARATGPTP